ncbi:hypothetical protein [Streptomyces apocyni]|uniref:hypothetical protein n=1 Tax=Streptomyces apocyni TaxID=2654677 RepID=UPI0012EAF532|nr:hypothetical protein [Streptomyces apocyni]
MSDSAKAPTTATATSEGASERAADLKGGPGHLVLVAVVLAVPVLKLTWTLGGGSQAREAFLSMEPANWPDVVIGMLLYEPLLFSVLAVVVSHASFAYFAARGGAQLRAAVPLAVPVATASVVPVTFGLLVGAFHGLWWGVGVAVAAEALRLGVIAEYRTGRRHAAGSGDRTRTRSSHTAPSGWREHAAEASRWVALTLAVLVLPLLAAVSALDGRSWTTVLECDVNTGQGTERARVVELGRKGTGVVGWDIEGGEVVNGVNCAVSHNEVVRSPWWRDA